MLLKFMEQQQNVFETYWNNSISAFEKIRNMGDLSNSNIFKQRITLWKKYGIIIIWKM